MIIIAFSRKTSRFIPKLFCRKYKHVAPIIVCNNNMIMLQFVRRGNIQKIPLSMRDIKILGQYGWRFVYLPRNLAHDFTARGARTCVEMTKRAIGIRDVRIQTPFGLYKKIR